MRASLCRVTASPGRAPAIRTALASRTSDRLCLRATTSSHELWCPASPDRAPHLQAPWQPAPHARAPGDSPLRMRTPRGHRPSSRAAQAAAAVPASRPRPLMCRGAAALRPTSRRAASGAVASSPCAHPWRAGQIPSPNRAPHARCAMNSPAWLQFGERDRKKTPMHGVREASNPPRFGAWRARGLQLLFIYLIFL